MKTWEIDIELRVCKTLTFGGPGTEAAARRLVEMIFAGQLDASHFVKWTDPRFGNRSMPVETPIDNEPRIVAVRGTLMADYLFRNGYVSVPGFAVDGLSSPEWFNELVLDLEAGRIYPEQAKEKMRQRGIWTCENSSAPGMPTNMQRADLPDPLAACYRPLARGTK